MYSSSSNINPQSCHFDRGNRALSTSTSEHATLAALDVINKGGNAIDGFIVAALVQCVVEHGSTSLCGAFAIHFYNAASGETQFANGWMRGSAAEHYSEDYSYQSPEAQTGPGMALPGYVEGIRAAHELGGRLPWKDLFEWPIYYAKEGFELTPNAYSMARVGNMSRYAEGQAIWMENGRYRVPGELIRQPSLAQTLKKLAEDGAEYFYQGEFAKHFIAKANALGGKHTLADMRNMLYSAEVGIQPLEGNYRDYKIVAPGNAMSIYAMHLVEAADLSSFKSSLHPEVVYAKSRIVEEVFLRSREYSEVTHSKFIEPSYAQERIDFVLNSPVRTESFDLLKANTNFIIVRDNDGNVAWCTHSINAAEAGGAGIIVDGVYASYLMNARHAKGSAGGPAGFMTNFALYQNGCPVYIAGTPGMGLFHGPFQTMINFGEFDMNAFEAVTIPRFGMGLKWTFDTLEMEGHFPEEVFQSLSHKGISYRRTSPSVATGLVGALRVDADGVAEIAQDPRRAGLAMAL